MTEAIRPVRGDIQVEDGIVSMRLECIYRKSQVCEPRAKLLRRLVNVDEFFKPVEADFHIRQHAVGAVGRVNESEKCQKQLYTPPRRRGIDTLLQPSDPFTCPMTAPTVQNCSRNRISFWKKSWRSLMLYFSMV